MQADETSCDSNGLNVSKPVPLQEQGEENKLSVGPEDAPEVPADGPLKEGPQASAPKAHQVPVPVFVPRLKQEGMAGWGGVFPLASWVPKHSAPGLMRTRSACWQLCPLPAWGMRPGCPLQKMSSVDLVLQISVRSRVIFPLSPLGGSLA